ncbi:hypothetical protein MMC19_006809 [Ptychographa xylographoides]|nr:hypothetical protein [Ptychographa xylographoides]
MARDHNQLPSGNNAGLFYDSSRQTSSQREYSFSDSTETLVDQEDQDHNTGPDSDYGQEVDDNPYDLTMHQVAHPLARLYPAAIHMVGPNAPSWGVPLDLDPNVDHVALARAAAVPETDPETLMVFPIRQPYGPPPPENQYPVNWAQHQANLANGRALEPQRPVYEEHHLGFPVPEPYCDMPFPFSRPDPDSETIPRQAPAPPSRSRLHQTICDRETILYDQLEELSFHHGRLVRDQYAAVEAALIRELEITQRNVKRILERECAARLPGPDDD